MANHATGGEVEIVRDPRLNATRQAISEAWGTDSRAGERAEYEIVRDPRVVEGGQQITAAIRREQVLREQLALEPHPFVFGPAYPFIEPYRDDCEDCCRYCTVRRTSDATFASWSST